MKLQFFGTTTQAQDGDLIIELVNHKPKKHKKMARKFYKENNESIPAIKFEIEIPAGFTLITDPVEIKSLYLKQYQTRIEDGNNTVQNFTADLYIDVLGGTYTDQEAFDLENHTKDLYSELKNGWWLTANHENQNLPLSGIYDQVMKDEMQILIDTYVLENY